jgi:hypothetical protein
LHNLHHYADYAYHVAGGITLFCTHEGFLGLAPGETADGDRLYLVRGACLPVVLRPASSSTWTFRGFAYVHGIGESRLVELIPDRKLDDDALTLS